MADEIRLRLLRSTSPDRTLRGGAGSPSSQLLRSPTQESCKVTSLKSAQWSPDGTTVLASSTDNTLTSYILPPDLLTSSPSTLSAYHTHQAPSPVYATAFSPAFSLSDPPSCLYLASPAALPVRLLSPFQAGLVATYPLVNPHTESYVAPHSLAFATSNRSHFVAGSDSQVALFDLSRPGSAPLAALATIPSKRKRAVGGGVGMKGVVSALASCPGDGLLAAGTFSRWIGLYAADGAGDFAGVFRLDGDGGGGITQLAWSACGRYLYVAERASDDLAVWDVRGSGRQLARLRGRNARSMQRLAFDVAGAAVWAGGTDGKVRVWDAPASHEGDVWPSAEVCVHRDGASVAAAAVHPCGTVLATCGSGRFFEDPGSDSEDGRSSGSGSVSESSLRIWSYEPPQDE